MLLRFASTAALAAALTFAASRPAAAALMPLEASAFGAGSTLTTFNGIAEGTEVNGLSVNGLTFAYAGGNNAASIVSLGIPSSNISDPVLQVLAFPFSPLSITFDSDIVAFGTGFEFASTVPMTMALTVEVFADGASLGELSFASAADENSFVSGGFAGLSSDEPFDRVVLTFNDQSAFAVALDNLRTIPATIPEPSSLALLGMAALAALRRRRSSTV